MNRLTRRRALQLLAAATTVPALLARADSPAAAGPVRAVAARVTPLAPSTRRLDGRLGRRLSVNVERRLLQIDEEAFIACFVNRDATDGLNQAWAGEHAGKFLDAACLTLSEQPHAELRRLADRVATRLVAAQGPDGYLGTYPVERRWTGWDVWVHKYNLIGLLAYHDLTGDAAALASCQRMFDLLERTFGDAPGQRDIIAAGEHMGMAATSVLEPVCRLYTRTGEPRVLAFADYLVRSYDRPGGPRIVSALLEHGRVHLTANGKAYEMLSNLVGLTDYHQITGQPHILRAVLAAWDDIVRHQRYPTGTVSAGEHFQRPPRMLSLAASNVGETCATVTWLQLNARLLQMTGESRYAAEIERTAYNHLPAAQDDSNGDISYYTAFAGLKEHSHQMVCCVSSGPRGLALLPSLAWGLQDDALVVNLYAAGHAACTFDGIAVSLASHTRFPDDGEVMLEFQPEQAVRFTLRLRVPEWTSHFEASAGKQLFTGRPGEYVAITRSWGAGDTVRVRMEMPTRTIPGAPTYPGSVGLVRGPQVLALDRAFNRDVPCLHRATIVSARVTPGDVDGRPTYSARGKCGVPDGANALRYEPAELVFVPFADARNYTVWLRSAAAPRHDLPAATAYARGSLSTALWLAGPEAQRPDTDLAETLTDENPTTFCTIDPRDPGPWEINKGARGNRGDAVWFTVVLDAPRPLTRIVFRHGPIGPAGGWFDTSRGKPRIEVVRSPIPTWKDAPYPSAHQAHWETATTLDRYPTSTATIPPDLTAGSALTASLEPGAMVYAIRIYGHPGGDYVSCAELSGYDA
jgi:hypothetical protein